MECFTTTLPIRNRYNEILSLDFHTFFQLEFATSIDNNVNFIPKNYHVDFLLWSLLRIS
jgi:hypothetical protein